MDIFIFCNILVFISHPINFSFFSDIRMAEAWWKTLCPHLYAQVIEFGKSEKMCLQSLPIYCLLHGIFFYQHRTTPVKDCNTKQKRRTSFQNISGGSRITSPTTGWAEHFSRAAPCPRTRFSSISR